MSQEQKIIVGLILITLFFLLVVFFVIAMTAYFHKRKKALLFEKKAIQSSYENELLKTKLEVHEQTLSDISQEIHDNIGQSLSLIKLNVAMMNLDNRADAEEKLLATNQQLIRTIQDLRDLSKTLNSDFIGKTGLVAGITRQVEILRRTGIYEIDFEIDGEQESYPAQHELVIYRILQEIINNIIKHAKANTICIKLNYLPDHLSVEVTDNGVGFDADSILASGPQGLGLGNITSRMKLIDGTATISSKPGTGTSISLHLPRKE